MNRKLVTAAFRRTTRFVLNRSYVSPTDYLVVNLQALLAVYHVCLI